MALFPFLLPDIYQGVYAKCSLLLLVLVVYCCFLFLFLLCAVAVSSHTHSPHNFLRANLLTPQPFNIKTMVVCIMVVTKKKTKQINKINDDDLCSSSFLKWSYTYKYEYNLNIHTHKCRYASPPGSIRVYRAGLLVMEDQVNVRPPPPIDISSVFEADSIAQAVYAKKFMGNFGNNNNNNNSGDGGEARRGSGSSFGELSEVNEVQHFLFEGYKDSSPIAPGSSVYKNAPQVQSLLKKSSFLRSISVGDLLNKDPNVSPSSGPQRTPSFRRTSSGRGGGMLLNNNNNNHPDNASIPNNPRSRESSEANDNDESEQTLKSISSRKHMFRDGEYRKTNDSKDLDDFELDGGRNSGSASGNGSGSGGGGGGGSSSPVSGSNVSSANHLKEMSLLSNLLGVERNGKKKKEKEKEVTHNPVHFLFSFCAFSS
jgi:hypothetical protein